MYVVYMCCVRVVGWRSVDVCVLDVLCMRCGYVKYAYGMSRVCCLRGFGMCCVGAVCGLYTVTCVMRCV